MGFRAFDRWRAFDALWVYSGGAGSPFDIHVDSVTGDDGYDGLTYATPFATLAAAETAALAAGNGVKVGLAYGSEWRDELNLETLDNVTVSAYGSAASGLPVVRGDDIITGSWDDSTDRADAYTNTYSLSIAHTLDITQAVGGPVIYVDDVLLDRKDTIAEVDAEAGTFYNGGDSSVSPVTVYVHPPGSTNPNSDGKAYEAVVRGWGIKVGDNCTVTRFWGKRTGNNGGSLRMGVNGYAEGCLNEDGYVHSSILAGGKYKRCVAWRQAGTVASDNPLLMEFYKSDGTGLDAIYEECIAVSAEPLTSGFGGHTDGANFFDTWQYIDCSAKGCTMAVGQGSISTVTRAYVVDAGISVPNTSAECTITDPYVRLESITAASVRGIVSTSPKTTIDGYRFYSENPYGLAFQSASVSSFTLTGSVFFTDYSEADGGGKTFLDLPEAAGITTAITGNVFDINLAATPMYLQFRGNTRTSGDNVFYPDSTAKLGVNFNWPNVNYTKVSSYLTAVQPAEEIGSVIASPQFTDPANGDFTLTGTGLPSNCGLERPSITYTPIPATLAEAEAWILNG